MSHRVLVVEDNAPFRRILCELLRQHGDVRIVGEAEDGIDAIRQAEALRPDLVTLDIGLPLLSGIEVAGRLRATVPQAKLIFVTVESSLEVAEQAFRSGGHGYVYKPRAKRDVLPVLEAVMRGGRFVSGGLERIAQGDSLARHHHQVLFCSSDAVLVAAFTRFIAGTLNAGHTVIALLTEAHGQSVHRGLQALHVDLDLAIRRKRYLAPNIDELLAKVMVNGWPEPARFQAAAGDLLTDSLHHAGREPATVAACGDCSSTVWAQGHVDAAIQLEQLWDEIGKSRQMDILCAYPLSAREQSAQTVRSLCAQHTVVEIC